MYLIETAYQSWLLMPVLALLGAVVGSFLSLVTYRLPLDLAIVAKRSACTRCHTKLGVRDLIPIASWLVFKGRCRKCKKPIGLRYPLTELACAAGAMLMVHYYGLTPHAFVLMLLWWAVVAIVITDLEHYIILDEVQVVMALLGAAFAYLNHTPINDVVLGALAGATLGLSLKYGFLYLAHKDGLGLGDVKFLGVAGIWLAHPSTFVPFLFFSGVLGIALGLIWRGLGKGDRFPFGPALAGALLACVVWPETADGFWQLYGVRP